MAHFLSRLCQCLVITHGIMTKIAVCKTRNRIKKRNETAVGKGFRGKSMLVDEQLKAKVCQSKWSSRSG